MPLSFWRRLWFCTLLLPSPLLWAPQHAATQTMGGVDEYIARGEMLFSQGNWDGAIQELRVAVQREPHRAEVRTTLGMAYYFKDDVSAAIPEFQAALRTDPNRVDAAYGLGLALHEAGNVKEAGVAFRTAARLNPMAYLNLGNVLEQQGDSDGALEAYTSYVAAAPRAPEARALREAVQMKKTPTPGAGTAKDHFLRGQRLLEKNDANAAVTEFLFALRLKPNYAEACNGLGLAFRLKGELDEAVAGYQRAIHLNPQFGVAHRNLAQAFEELGERALAAQAYDRYLLLVPGAPDAAQIREKIAQLRRGG